MMNNRKDHDLKSELEIMKLKQELFSLMREESRKSAEEERKVAQELRAIEDQEMKRQEERRKESAEIRLELTLWVSFLAGAFPFGLGVIRFFKVPPIVSTIVGTTLLVLAGLTALLLFCRLVVKLAKCFK